MPRKNWKNLKNNVCPACGYDLDIEENGYRVCKNNLCGFSITEEKFEEIVDNLDRGERGKKMEGFGFE